MKNFNEELRQLQEQLVRKNKVSAMLGSLQDTQRKLMEEEIRLREIRKNEQADVDRLKRVSLTSIFYTVISQKREKLTAEEAEAYAAATKHDAVLRQLEAVTAEIEALHKEFVSLRGCDAQYQKVLGEKAAALKVENPACADEICKLEEQIGYRNSQCKELSEALSVGKNVMETISAVEDSLNSAEGWGTFDLLGGGLLSDMAKHSHLDDAQQMVEELQDELRRYHTELADVTITADLNVRIEGFLSFADYMFDGLFADWAALDHINTSQENIADTRHQVEQVQEKLERSISSAREEIKRMQLQLDELILNA